MKISLVRIDNRLLHATVAINWSSFLNASEIMLVDPTYVDDPFIEKVLQLSLPKKIKINICSVTQLTKNLEERKGIKGNVIIIFKSLQILEEAVEKGFYFPEIQIPYPASSILLKQAEEYFSQDERNTIANLVKKNIKFYLQTVPMESKNYAIFKKK